MENPESAKTTNMEISEVCYFTEMGNPENAKPVHTTSSEIPDCTKM